VTDRDYRNIGKFCDSIEQLIALITLDHVRDRGQCRQIGKYWKSVSTQLLSQRTCDMCEQINIMAALAEAMGCLIRHNFGAASTTQRNRDKQNPAHRHPFVCR
jgi:hypothetical protein